MRFAPLLLILLVGLGIGWSVGNWQHQDDTCNVLRREYQIATSDEYLNLVTSSTNRSDWNRLVGTYGEQAASAIMDARFNAPRLIGAFLASSVDAECN